MKHRNDLEVVASRPIRNHIGCAGDHELTRAGHSAGTTKIRQLGQAFDGGQERRGDTAGRAGAIARDVSTKVSKVADRARRPDDGHARGAFLSRFRPHERSQVDTSL